MERTIKAYVQQQDNNHIWLEDVILTQDELDSNEKINVLFNNWINVNFVKKVKFCVMEYSDWWVSQKFWFDVDIHARRSAFGWEDNKPTKFEISRPSIWSQSIDDTFMFTKLMNYAVDWAYVLQHLS